MRVIGITGGVGSGKSEVLSYLEKEYHALICQADHVAWKLQMPGETCYEAIVSHFGRGILNEDGTIDRRILGAIVFENEKEMDALNHIMHPGVKQYICDQIAIAKKSDVACFVIEAALLLDDHYDEICDELWYIYTKESVRRERLKISRGYSDDKIDHMIRNQLSEDDFLKGCQVVIHNSDTFEKTKAEIDKVMKENSRR